MGTNFHMKCKLFGNQGQVSLRPLWELGFHNVPKAIQGIKSPQNKKISTRALRMWGCMFITNIFWGGYDVPKKLD